MYFQRKGKNGTAVYVYHHTDGKNKPLPRSITKQLDGKMDWEVEDWMLWWAAVNAVSHRKPRASLGSLADLVDGCLGFMESQGLNKKTVSIHKDRLYDILPFFADKPIHDTWYLKIGELYSWMLDKDWTPQRHNACNVSFRAFYRWLQDQGIVKHRHSIALRNRPVLGRKTPLKYTLTPEQVLAHVASLSKPEFRLMALVGFFFSLRTDEVFGLRRSDFIAGSRAQIMEASKVMAKRGLYSKLVVNIRQCRRGSGEIYSPSNRKRGGIVSCFDAKAAKLIVELIKTIPKHPLLKDKDGKYTIEPPIIGHYKPNWWSVQWRTKGIPELTQKDLRRASLYWLGHYTEFNLVDLQNHARHTNPLTTSLYTRRPEEEFDSGQFDELDLDA